MLLNLFMRMQIPDPERAYINIRTFLTKNPAHADPLNTHLEPITTLFSYSQFLANYCIDYPDTLFDAFNHLDKGLAAEQLMGELKELLSSFNSLNDGMRVIRHFKKKKLLIITLKDILKKVDFQDIMSDLTTLADTILSVSLHFVESFIQRHFGVPVNNSLAVIGLGKLGAEELNYSSDVDIMFVYKNEGETSGIQTLQGSTHNNISAFEYYTKLVEEYARFLSTNTEDGFAYRVDLRLRPQGQRGSLALSMRSYEVYYESWGQRWERAALLRARPVAGNNELGNNFMKMIQPFVFRKYLDFDAIDEIMRLKSQVEQIKSGTLSRDIKRGYGGIREIEFFVHIFQLIYGGREQFLRERSTLKALHRLLQKRLIGYEDFQHLSDNYVFLRTLEHRLQQLNDVQTHTLPSNERELDVLGKKLGFPDRTSFLSELEKRRLIVRSIYDSLLKFQKPFPEKPSEGLLSSIFWDMDTPVEHLLTDELSKTNIKDIHKSIHCLTKIRNNMYTFQTLKGRRLLDDVIPRFVDDALKGVNPDLALLHLVDFSSILATKESYLETLSQRQEIISLLNFVFSHSEYLSKILMSSPEYIEFLVEGELIRKTSKILKNDLKQFIDRQGEPTAIRLFKKLEEMKVGILFLNRRITITELMNGLSRVADAILSTLINPVSPLAVIGYGKLGGREITFNSDLDLIFVTQENPAETDINIAEKLLKLLMSYTKDGIAYTVDARLRPEGSKGPLVNSIKGITDYYSKHAQPWELQALLKARPVAGGIIPSRHFMKTRGAILMKRGVEIKKSDIQKMRERIRREIVKESIDHGSYDIKLGEGGLEELEFTIQYLQLKNCNNPELLVQSTLDSMKRLNKYGILKDSDAAFFHKTYVFYRTIETLLRLRNETILKEGSATMQGVAHFLHMDVDKLRNFLIEKRLWVNNFWDNLSD